MKSSRQHPRAPFKSEEDCNEEKTQNTQAFFFGSVQAQS